MKLQIRDALVGLIPGAPATVSGPDFISVVIVTLKSTRQKDGDQTCEMLIKQQR